MENIYFLFGWFFLGVKKHHITTIIQLGIAFISSAIHLYFHNPTSKNKNKNQITNFQVFPFLHHYFLIFHILQIIYKTGPQELHPKTVKTYINTTT
ncbi:hypothetical protein Hanom_Chr05g00463401 [Helianthus anomalus]